MTSDAGFRKDEGAANGDSAFFHALQPIGVVGVGDSRRSPPAVSPVAPKTARASCPAQQALENFTAVGFDLEVEEVIGSRHALIDRGHEQAALACMVDEAEARVNHQ